MHTYGIFSGGAKHRVKVSNTARCSAPPLNIDKGQIYCIYSAFPMSLTALSLVPFIAYNQPWNCDIEAAEDLHTLQVS
jgi:hypothetical protein